MDLEDKYSKKLLAYLSEYSLKLDLEKVKQAMLITKKAHEGQYRDCGKPYYSHPIDVSILVLSIYQNTINTDLIVASLLHDVVEDSDISIDKINELFGANVSNIVSLLTRTEENGNKITIQELMERLIQEGNEDSKKIKLCDRIHNLLTMDQRPKEKIIKEINETINSHFISIGSESGIDIEKIIAKIISVEINYNFIDRAYIDFSYKLPVSRPKI